MTHIDLINLEMKKQKITQTAMAILINVSRPSLSDILNQKVNPVHSTVEKMANVLGLSLKKD